ncbi:MAG TPA: hypothetical protein VG840_01045, partial [Casimicrobiaceae bacterium]|nr:hypothetical protein [Casimicrobiaceae bacterium]
MARERALDERAALAEAAAWIQQCIDAFASEVLHDFRLAGENVAQVRVLRECPPTGARHERVCGVATDRRRQRHLHGLGVDQTVREPEISTHAFDVDLEALRDVEHRRKRARR